MNVAEYRKLSIKKPSKYRAQKTEVDGFTFDSKLEATYYKFLKLSQHHGTITYFHRQVPIHLPGNVKMVVDFLVFYADGKVSYEDVKGPKPTRDWINKKKTVEALYPFKINIIESDSVKKLAKGYGITNT